MSKTLQIIIGLAVFLITGSVFYYYILFLPQELKLEKENKLMDYKIKFQKECNNYYDELIATEETKDINKSVEIANLMCQINPHDFKIDSIFTCKERLPYVISKEQYVSLCIDYKMEEINLSQ
jgi:hypothetical protein